MKFSEILEKIETGVDEFERKDDAEQARNERKAQEGVKDYRKLAEQALIVKHLKHKKEMSEKEKSFVTKVEAIELTEDERTKVTEEITKLMDERKKMKKDKEKDKKDEKAD